MVASMFAAASLVTVAPVYADDPTPPTPTNIPDECVPYVMQVVDVVTRLTQENAILKDKLTTHDAMLDDARIQLDQLTTQHNADQDVISAKEARLTHARTVIANKDDRITRLRARIDRLRSR